MKTPEDMNYALTEIIDDNVWLNLEKYVKAFPNADPFQAFIWGDFVLRLKHVQYYFQYGPRRAAPVMSDSSIILHEQRVAWLMVNGWCDPIQLDVCLSSDTPTWDGNHRVAAALALGYSHILAGCSGFVDVIDSLL